MLDVKVKLEQQQHIKEEIDLRNIWREIKGLHENLT